MFAAGWVRALACAALVLNGCGARTGLGAEGDDDGDDTNLLPPGCTDTGQPTVFVVSSSDDLFSFDPPAVSLARVGRLRCGSSTPNSMAVSRNGEAFVSYVEGNLYRVSTVDASCTDTAFDPGELRADHYGMGFAADPTTGVETLYIAESFISGPSRGLEIIDTKTFDLVFVAPFDPPLRRTELTGTGDGRLYGYVMDDVGSRLVTIDEATARVSTERSFDFGGNDFSFAFAFWGGDFYLFTSSADEGSTVSRYSPSTDTLEDVGQVEAEIVGAGVSTCAPL